MNTINQQTAHRSRTTDCVGNWWASHMCNKIWSNDNRTIYITVLRSCKPRQQNRSSRQVCSKLFCSVIKLIIRKTKLMATTPRYFIVVLLNFSVYQQLYYAHPTLAPTSRYFTQYFRIYFWLFL